MDPDREDDRRDRSPGRECERVAEDFRNGLVPFPAVLGQAREEVARPGRQEGNDWGRHEVGERDRRDRMLDDGGPLETDGALSPGLPDRNDAARWQSRSIRPCRPRPIVSESMPPRRATLRSRRSLKGSMNVPIRPSSLGNAPSAGERHMAATEIRSWPARAASLWRALERMPAYQVPIVLGGALAALVGAVALGVAVVAGRGLGVSLGRALLLIVFRAFGLLWEKGARAELVNGCRVV